MALQRYKDLAGTLRGIALLDRIMEDDSFRPRPVYGSYDAGNFWVAYLVYPITNTFKHTFSLYFRKAEEGVKFGATLMLGYTWNETAMNFNNLIKPVDNLLTEPPLFYTNKIQYDVPRIKEHTMGSKDEIRGIILPQDDENIVDLFLLIQEHNIEMSDRPHWW